MATTCAISGIVVSAAPKTSRSWRRPFHSSQVRRLARSSSESAASATKSGSARSAAPIVNQSASSVPLRCWYPTSSRRSAADASVAITLSFCPRRVHRDVGQVGEAAERVRLPIGGGLGARPRLLG